ncbi:MAG: class I SAM-dependent methyltransferase [Actinobacteria bacterium]|nr:class I SAM-dependent methyltransferase [Actinomycetota bacterium]NIS32801.1 class I SAM-dependent methyltransferase [Actinomycetota bacterium]NIT96463.1 class I SAM-dependent methyltransferase [Actinomycetota bacterium]NIU20160.1 class I SAM-dependent methyltransferase [Actinomycetota bacterium]NIU67779.1 class I SAM-dependent methyltransferase [Actinomycetota bacterium]
MSEIRTYYGLLRRAHEILRPARYLEIGVHEGHSLAFVGEGTRAVGVDPEPKVADPPADTVIVPTTSDAFFADPELVALLGGPVDLAFVDGLHLHEQTLRDVANTERHAAPDGVILIHDCLPIDARTSARTRSTVVWSGDVWKVVVALRRHRPDLTVTTVDVEPTGMAIVSGLDPSNTVLFDRYDEILAELADLEYDDLEAVGREAMLGLVPGEWERVEPLLAG